MAQIGNPIAVPAKTFHAGVPAPAQNVVGPFTIPAGVTGATLKVDRTVARGLDTLTTATWVTQEWDVSADAGTTWEVQATNGDPTISGDGWVGGTVVRANGSRATDEWTSVDGIIPGNSIRLIITVAGTANVVLGGGNSTLTLFDNT